MEVQMGVRRMAMSATITRADGRVEERVVAFCSSDAQEHARVNAMLDRGQHFREETVIPHGVMTPVEA